MDTGYTDRHGNTIKLGDRVRSVCPHVGDPKWGACSETVPHEGIVAIDEFFPNAWYPYKTVPRIHYPLYRTDMIEKV